MSSRPEDFLEILRKARRGRFKLFIGFAAGVGKTYRMLEEAHALKKRGVDVVLGFVETHGRTETESLVGGLEVVPRTRLAYRDLVIEELDLEAILQRKPEVVVVDELAHTNAPGVRNQRRYQDVQELLAAGISVIGALNVQHIESLNDVVKGATDVTVRETVPDKFIAQADQIVNIDLAVEDLVERLKAGKIYAPEKVAGALANFFADRKLGMLRELALREVAQSLERAGLRGRKTGDPGGAVGRVMLCMSARPHKASGLLRRGARLADRLGTDWFVVYVETPREAPDVIDAEAHRMLLDNVAKARELGAEVVRLKGEDPVATVLDFARSHDVRHIVVGRSKLGWWRQVIGASFPLRLLREAEGLDLHVVAVDQDPTR